MDRELLLRARAGDREAFGLIVVEKGEALLRTAQAILGTEADARDAVQETFVNAWRRLGGLRDAERFDAWLGRILINECRQVLRQRRRVREVALGTGVAASHLPADDGSDPASAYFDAAFNRLPVDQRALLVLHHLHGYGVRDIAAWLGIPAGTVKWRLARARRALAAELTNDA
jgi:RNA polymerase sigma-70 factor (ECF subfamily)